MEGMFTPMAARFGRIVCQRSGGPETLTVTEEPLRDAVNDEVRIRVLAAGVAWADIMMRHGTYPDQPKFPFTPGYDIVGVLDQTGPKTRTLSRGQVVAVMTKVGGYSEVVYTPESECVPVPHGADPFEAVCVVLNYVTAFQMLTRVVPLNSGDPILVHSAAGGVGTALLEIGRNLGLKTIGTASKGKHALLTKLGCEPIDYKSEKFEDAVRRSVPDGVAAAFDPIGGSNWLRSRKCVRKGGAVVAFGSQGAGKIADVGSVVALKLSPGPKFIFYSIATQKAKEPEHFRQDLVGVLRMLADRKIKPVIGRRMPWQQAAEANDLLEKGAVEGKIVLTF